MMPKTKKADLPDPPKLKGNPKELAPKGGTTIRPWTKKELDFLRRNYAKLGPKGCAARLGRSYAAVACKAWELGCTRRHKDKASLWLRLKRLLRPNKYA